MSAVECVLKTRSILGESPLWDEVERRLYWLDLRKPAIYRFDPATGKNSRVKAALQAYIGGMVLRKAGGMTIVDQRGIFTLDPSNGRMKPFAKPVKDMRPVWFNDAKCDRQGNLWAGVGDRKEQKALGVFFRIGPRGKATKIDSKFICPNGPAFSPDGRTCYFADSYANKIYRYDIEPSTGKVSPRHLFAAVPEGQGVPDGMTVDAEGGVWSCQWDGWRVTRYAADGRVDRIIELPVPRPTSVAFGGEDLATLYITTASIDLTREQVKQAPLSGSLFACQPGVRGLVEPRFAG
ncbi:MAG TPA: SMP-30/gluconolactonase/LRE family protein [Dongiaceae bacterium]|jgi:sugar lactone lactonase YvrE|nr:SMP-30/gluconolactonase/LRE family protein [Dongiaceae bacterium]